MAYTHVTLPEGGAKVTLDNGKLNVPDNPILGFVEGDGIGPDITQASLRVWDAAVAKAYGGKRKVHWCELYLGEKAAGLYEGDYFPAETLDAIKELRVAIKGPLTTPVGGGFRSLNVSLRQEGTAENKKLAKFLREEMGVDFFEDAGLGIKPISAFGTKRLVRMAIQYAIEHGKSSVTLVHKGNIMKFTEGAFRNWGYELAKEEFGDQVIDEATVWEKHDGKVPEGKIMIQDRIADIMFQLMQLRPAEFEVLATMNLNGDYLSDALAAEVGGVGIAPGANISDEVAVFEATHGTAPKYSNQNKVNPSSLLLSGVMMLEHIGWNEAADSIKSAFGQVIQDKTVTYDFARQMDGATTVGTAEFADALIAKINA